MSLTEDNSHENDLSIESGLHSGEETGSVLVSVATRERFNDFGDEGELEFRREREGACIDSRETREEDRNEGEQRNRDEQHEDLENRQGFET